MLALAIVALAVGTLELKHYFHKWLSWSDTSWTDWVAVGGSAGQGGQGGDIFFFVVDLTFTIHAVPIPWLEWPYLAVAIINAHHYINVDITATDASF